MRSLLYLILIFILASGVAAIDFGADLLGENVVPPTPSAGTGFFSATVTCNPESADSTSLSFYIGYIGLTSQATGAHIHLGEPDSNGPVVIDLIVGPFWFVVDIVNISQEHCEALAAGQLYVVIESGAYPEGEVRGQIYPSPVPTERKSWGKIKYDRK